MTVASLRILTETLGWPGIPIPIVPKVTDNGKGFEKSKTGTFSNGLGNMTKRAHACQGKLVIESIPGKGTIVLLDLPF